jgi:hypothetical protein
VSFSIPQYISYLARGKGILNKNRQKWKGYKLNPNWEKIEIGKCFN